MKIWIFLVLFMASCANAKYVEMDARGKVKKEISYKVVGKREFKNLKVNIKDGKIELGSSQGDSGAIGAALQNATQTALNLSSPKP